MGIADAILGANIAKADAATRYQRIGSLDIRNFLPVGTPLDGTVDVGPSIRVAVAAAGSRGLYFGPGTYLCKTLASTMQAPAGLHVWADPGTVTILFDTTVPGEFREFCRNNGDEVTWENVTIRRNGAFPSVIFPVQNRTGFTLRRVTLDGQGDAFSGQYCHGLQLGVSAGTADDICLDRAILTKLTYGLFQTNASTGTTKNIRVTNCRFIANYATDLEFNNPLGVMTGIRVIDSYFYNNQATTTGGGFGVGLAFCQDVKIRGNTFSLYNNEAIHIEDYSSDVTIDDNGISQCGQLFTGVIQVISGSSNIRITNNRISTVGNTSSVVIFNLLAGGTGLTPGGRTGIAPNLIVIQGNMVSVGGTTKALYAESVLYLNIADNQFSGPGNVNSGSYGGPFGYAMQIYTGTHTTITGNMFSGFTYGISPQGATIGAFGTGSVIADNIFRRCLLGLALINSDSLTVTGNMFHTCVIPMALGQAGVANSNLVITGNNATLCTYPMAIYGTTQLTAAAAVTTGTGKTLTISGFLLNTLPIGTVIVFSGGGIFTTTAVATVTSGSAAGTLTVANVAANETAVAYLPYSSDTTKNRTIANNGDDYYGAAGHGIKVVSVSASYRVLGYEGLILATAGGIILTLPPAANHRGMGFTLKNTGRNCGHPCGGLRKRGRGRAPSLSRPPGALMPFRTAATGGSPPDPLSA